MDMHDFKLLPNKATEYYEKDKVKPPLSPEEQEAMLAEMEQKSKEKKKKKDAKKAGKKGKKGKLSERDEFLKERTQKGPTETV